MTISLRNLINLRLIVIETYLEFLQVLKYRKGKWTIDSTARKMEFALQDERNSIRRLLNNLELEGICNS